MLAKLDARAAPRPRPLLRAQVGRLPLHRLPRRGRRRAGQPQREAADALLPRARRRTPARAARAAACSTARSSSPGPSGLEFDALSQRIHPAEKRIRQLAESTPASFVAFDLLADGDRSLHGGAVRPSAARRSRRRCRKVRPPVHLTPVTEDPDVAADWFSRFEGAGLDGVVAKASDLHYLPDKRAMLKVKHQRTADCVVAGLPHAQGRRRRRLAAPGAVRRRRDAAPRRRGLGVQRGPAA